MSTYRSLFLAGIAGIVAMALWIVALPVAAQTPPSEDAQSLSVFVTDLTLDKTTFEAGEDVTGSFVLWNDKENYAPNIYYRIHFAGRYVDDMPTVYYDSVMSNPVSLAPLEHKKVNFSYTLPKVIPSGETSIVVKSILKSGKTLGFADKMITVKGGLGYLEAKTGSVVVDGKTFNINAGPTVPEGKKVQITASFTNTGKTDISAKTVLSLRTFGDMTKVIRTIEGEEMVFPAGKTTAVTLDIPTEGFAPQVYVGALDLVDAESVRRGGISEFRYILGGDIFNIFLLTAQKVAAAKGEDIALTLKYGGTPLDVNDGRPFDTVLPENNIELTTVLINERSVVVASTTETFNANAGNSKTYTVKAGTAARALRAELTATKNGKVLSAAQFTLSPDFEARAAEAAREANDSSVKTTTMITSLVVGILIGLFIVWRIIKRERKMRMPIAMLAILFAASAWFVAPSLVSASTNLDNAEEGGVGIRDEWKELSFTVTSPSGIYDSKIPGVPASPGAVDEFKVEGSLVSNSCLNEVINSGLYGIVLEVKYQKIDGSGEVWGKKLLQRKSDTVRDESMVSVGRGVGGESNFGVATGQREVYVRVTVWHSLEDARNYFTDYAGRDNTYYKNKARRYITGYRNLNIRPRVSFNAEPSSIVKGQSSNLVWKANADASVCVAPDFDTRNRTDSSETVSPLSTKTYTITCRGIPESNPFLKVSKEATVNVTVPPPDEEPDPALAVELKAEPPSGNVTFSPKLTAAVTGGVNPSIRQYKFRCNTGENPSAWQPGNTYQGCSYSAAATYTASVEVKEGTLNANDSVDITVAAPTITPPPPCTGGCVPPDPDPDPDPEPTPTPPVTVTPSCYPVNPRNSGPISSTSAIGQAQVGTPVKWVIENAQNNKVYTWTGADVSSVQGETLIKTYSTVGLKNMRVSWDGGSAECKINNRDLRISVEPGYREF